MILDLCQTHILWEDKKANILNARHIVEKSNADILFFPEMSFTGFSFNIDVTGESAFETVNAIKKLALDYSKTIAFGWVNKNGDKAENHYSVVDSKGNVISDYVKLHPFTYSGEDKFFSKGNKLSFFELSGFKFAAFICYDLRFGDIFTLASKKADVIVVGANWPKSRADHWKTLLKARAIENQCYVLGINCVGNIGGLDYSGDSCVISPDGSVINMLSDKEGVITAKLKNDVASYRQSFPVRNDRREKLYSILAQECGQ